MAQSRSSVAQIFATELRRLYDRAGRPTYGALQRYARTRQPPLTLPQSSLSAWLNPDKPTIPKDPRAVWVLVAYLEPLAQRHSSDQPRGPAWWEQLRRQAWHETHVRRGGRPRTPPVEDATEEQAEPLGRRIGDLDEADAVALEVHQAVQLDQPGGTPAALPVLPRYLPRPHDEALRGELRLAEQRSRLVVLVGGSSTGKTRACWEAVRAVLPHWRLWHPLTPERPDALIDALGSGRIAPRTVIWLNEAQLYLGPAGVGERVASALQALLHQPAQGPILVLASMWPRFWEGLTDTNASDHAASRELLRTARRIPVPPSFGGDQLTELRAEIAADPRLALAAETVGGRITQFLAGAFELVARYEEADEATRAVLWAAMDARRLGHGPYLPEDFLHRAASGYFDNDVWAQTPPDWFARALAYLTRPCHGVPGPLSPHRPRPGDPALDAPAHRLADYLEQLGRATRAAVYPPTGFWDAVVATITEPADLIQLAHAACDRLRYCRAALLYRQAADRGDRDALWWLTQLPPKHPSYRARAEAAARQAAAREAVDRSGHLDRLFGLAYLRERAGDRAGAEAAVREAADRGDPDLLGAMAWKRAEAGDRAGAEALAGEVVDRGSAYALDLLATLLDTEQGQRLRRFGLNDDGSLADPW
jgi:hypothetical protein